jgi:hypothetical protein
MEQQNNNRAKSEKSRSFKAWKMIQIMADD